MNEEVINDLYSRAQSLGYRKSKDDFSNLLMTNDEVFQDNFSYVKSKGYKKSQDDFSILIGKTTQGPGKDRPGSGAGASGGLRLPSNLNKQQVKNYLGKYGASLTDAQYEQIAKEASGKSLDEAVSIANSIATAPVRTQFAPAWQPAQTNEAAAPNFNLNTFVAEEVQRPKTAQELDALKENQFETQRNVMISARDQYISETENNMIRLADDVISGKITQLDLGPLGTYDIGSLEKETGIFSKLKDNPILLKSKVTDYISNGSPLKDISAEKVLPYLDSYANIRELKKQNEARIQNINNELEFISQNPNVDQNVIDGLKADLKKEKSIQNVVNPSISALYDQLDIIDAAPIALKGFGLSLWDPFLSVANGLVEEMGILVNPALAPLATYIKPVLKEKVTQAQAENDIRMQNLQFKEISDQSILDGLNLMNVSRTTGTTIGSMGAIFAGGLAAGPIGAGYMGFTLVYGDSLDEARKSGFSEAESQLYATIYGTASAALEAFGFKGVANAFMNTAVKKQILSTIRSMMASGATKEQILKEVMRKGLRSSLSFLQGAAPEALTEMSQTAAELGTKKAFNLLLADTELGEQGFELPTMEEGLKQIAEAGIIGGVFGGFVPGVKSLTRSKKNEYKNLAKSVVKGDVSQESLKNNVATLVNTGSITQQQGAELMQNLEIALAAKNSLPTYITDNAARERGVELILERNKIAEEMKNSDEDLQDGYKQRLTQIKAELKTISDNKWKAPVDPVIATTVAGLETMTQSLSTHPEPDTAARVFTESLNADRGMLAVLADAMAAGKEIAMPVIERASAALSALADAFESNPQQTEYTKAAASQAREMADRLSQYTTTVPSVTNGQIPSLSSKEIIGRIKAGVDAGTIDFMENTPEEIAATFSDIMDGKDVSEADAIAVSDFLYGRYKQIMDIRTDLQNKIEEESSPKKKAKLKKSVQAINDVLSRLNADIEASVKYQQEKALQDEAAGTRKKTPLGQPKQEQAPAPTPAQEFDPRNIDQVADDYQQKTGDVLTKEMATALKAVAKLLAKIAPNVKFYVHSTTQEFIDAIRNEGVNEDQSDRAGTVVQGLDGKIESVHINLEEALGATPANQAKFVYHEAAHVLLDVFFRSDYYGAPQPALIFDMAEAIRLALPDKYKGPLAEFLSRYEDGSGRAKFIKAEESIAELIDMLANDEANLDKPTISKIIAVINDFITAACEKFGVDPEKFLLSNNRSDLIDFVNSTAKAVRSGLSSDISEKATTRLQRKYAVQEQAAGEVPVQSRTKAGRTLAKGESKTGPQETAQEGGQKEEVTPSRTAEVLFTTATLRDISVKTKHISKLTNLFDEAVKSVPYFTADAFSSGGSKIVRSINNFASGILDGYAELIAAVSESIGVKYKSGNYYIGSWEGSFEPSMNISFSITDDTNTQALSDLFNKLSEDTSQDAYIIETVAKQDQEFRKTGKIILFTQLQDGTSIYPQIKVEFKDNLSVSERAGLAKLLSDGNIPAFSIGDNFVKMSSFAEDVDDYKDEKSNFENIIKNSEFSDLYSKTTEQIKQSNYIAGEKDGNRRNYNRSDVFEAFKPSAKQSRAKQTKAGRTRGILGTGGKEGGSLAPLEGAPIIRGATGPDPKLVAVAEQYAKENGIDLKRQAEYVQVDEDRARRIAAAYDEMVSDPSNPKVKKAYRELIKQTKKQYDALVKAGYKFTFFDSESDPYDGNPSSAMRDLRANKKMAVYGTYDGFGTEGITDSAIKNNPLLEDTGLRWKDQSGELKPVTANDLFRAVHDAFGHGLEGASFRARGEENAWQAHVRLFTGDAIAAITSETRGQNSWVNYGPYGDKNKTAAVENTVFAEQKVGILPEWTWTEGRAGDMEQEAPAPGKKTKAGRTLAKGEFKTGPQKTAQEGGQEEEVTPRKKAEKSPLSTTKQQIEKFGVAPEMVEPVSDVISKVFESLKKAGLTTAKNVAEWVGIGKGEEKPYSLRIDGKDVQVKNVAPEVVNGFYSNTERALSQVKQEKMSGNQWVTQLLSRGANKEEMQFTGLEGFLKENAAKPTSKSDIESFLKDNRISIVEVVKGVKKRTPLEQASKDDIYNSINEQLSRTNQPQEVVDFVSEKLDNWYNDPSDRNYRSLDGALGEANLNIDDFTESGKEEVDDTKYSEYQLEGESSNYKEILVTLPSKGPRLSFEKWADEYYGDITDLTPSQLKLVNEQYQKSLKDDFTKQANLATRETKFRSTHFEEPNILVHLRMNTRYFSLGNETYLDPKTHKPKFDEAFELIDNGDSYQVKKTGASSPYFNTYSKKVLSDNNMSANDLKEFLMKYERLGSLHPDFEGNKKKKQVKVLFLEEIQSDWGQQGKKEGFKDEIKERLNNERNKIIDQWRGTSSSLSKEEKERLNKLEAKSPAYLQNEEYDELKSLRSKVRDGINAAGKRLAELNAELGFDKYSTQQQYFGAKISTAPFVMDTNAWAKLGLKVALKEAVAQGADKIAWTTGEQQNERYDLSKQVNKIDVEAVEEAGGVYFVDIELSSGTIENLEVENGIIREGDYKGQRLEDVIGKEYAEKVLSTPKGESATLRGDDLKLGGKGMKGFYDKIIPDVATALVKNLTGKKGEIGEVVLKDGGYALVQDGVTQDVFETKEIAEQAKKEILPRAEIVKKGIQQSIDITPELKASVEQGQPLFKDADAQYHIENGKNIIEAIKDFNGSPRSVVALTHEIMHPTVVAIVDGASEGNEVGAKHTQTIVDEYNKANPKSKVTVDELISGNNDFKNGKTTKQYRSVQEFIAESWEKYHTEGGKGFSKAFQEVLEQITKAFRSVYQAISGKQLTPELRKMFDEILGQDQGGDVQAEPTLGKKTKAGRTRAGSFKNGYDPNEAADRGNQEDRDLQKRIYDAALEVWDSTKDLMDLSADIYEVVSDKLGIGLNPIHIGELVKDLRTGNRPEYSKNQEGKYKRSNTRQREGSVMTSALEALERLATDRRVNKGIIASLKKALKGGPQYTVEGQMDIESIADALFDIFGGSTNLTALQELYNIAEMTKGGLRSFMFARVANDAWNKARESKDQQEKLAYREIGNKAVMQLGQEATEAGRFNAMIYRIQKLNPEFLAAYQKTQLREETESQMRSSGKKKSNVVSATTALNTAQTQASEQAANSPSVQAAINTATGTPPSTSTPPPAPKSKPGAPKPPAPKPAPAPAANKVVDDRIKELKGKLKDIFSGKKTKAARVLPASMNPEILDIITELARNYIKKGMTDRTALISKINGDVTAAGGSITMDYFTEMWNDVQGEAVQQRNSAAADSLANRIVGKVKGAIRTSTKTFDPIAELITDLVNKGTEDVETPKRAKESPLEKIKRLLVEFDSAKKIWEASKAKVEAKIDGLDPVRFTLSEKAEMKAMLDNFFANDLSYFEIKKTSTPSPDATVRNAIKQEMKDKKLKIEEILLTANSKKAETRDQFIQNIVDDIVNSTGISYSQAIKIAEDFTKKYDQIVTQKQESILKRYSNPARVRNIKKKSQGQRAFEMIKYGALDPSIEIHDKDGNIIDSAMLLAEIFGIPYIDDVARDALDVYAEAIADTPEGVIRQQVINDMMMFMKMHQYRQLGSLGDRIMSQFYANLLTSTDTLLKAFNSNVLMNPFEYLSIATRAAVKGDFALIPLLTRGFYQQKGVGSVKELKATKAMADVDGYVINQGESYYLFNDKTIMSLANPKAVALSGHYEGLLRYSASMNQARGVLENIVLHENFTNNVTGAVYEKHAKTRAGRNWGRYVTLAQKGLGALDALVTAGATGARYSDLLYDAIKFYAKSEKVKIKGSEIVKIVNLLQGYSSMVQLDAYNQAIAEMEIAEGGPVDLSDRKKKTLLLLRVEEIVREKMKDRYQQAVNEHPWLAGLEQQEIADMLDQAKEISTKIGLMGTPPGTSGVISHLLGLPGKTVRFSNMQYGAFTNAPVNAANFLMQGNTPLAAFILGVRLLKSQRGLGLGSDEFFKKQGIRTEMYGKTTRERQLLKGTKLTWNLEKQDMLTKFIMIQAPVIAMTIMAANAVMVALASMFDDDEDRDKLLKDGVEFLRTIPQKDRELMFFGDPLSPDAKKKAGVWKTLPFYTTGAMYGYADGGYGKMQSLRARFGVEPYTVYSYGKKVFSYKDNPLLGAFFMEMAASTDALLFNETANLEDTQLGMIMVSTWSQMNLIRDQSNLRSISEIVELFAGQRAYEGLDGYNARAKMYLSKTAANILSNLTIPAEMKNLNQDIMAMVGQSMDDPKTFLEFVVYRWPIIGNAVIEGDKTGPFGYPLKMQPKRVFPIGTEQFKLPLMLDGTLDVPTIDQLLSTEDAQYTALFERNKNDKFLKPGISGYYKLNKYGDYERETFTLEEQKKIREEYKLIMREFAEENIGLTQSPKEFDIRLKIFLGQYGVETGKNRVQTIGYKRYIVNKVMGSKASDILLDEADGLYNMNEDQLILDKIKQTEEGFEPLPR